MANTKYPLRTFTIPIGWEPIKISTDIYTNSIIDILYNQFSCCLGQKGANKTNELTKGNKCGCECDIEWLIQSLYVLRNWYSGGFTIPLPTDTTHGFTMSLYWEQTNTSDFNNEPLVVNVTASSPYSNLVSVLELALPNGYTATLIGSSIYVQTVNQQKPFVYYYIYNGSSISTGWAALDLNPTMPYRVIQLIIQKCLQICGCINCQTVQALENDNDYVPLGVVIPTSIHNSCNYTNIYFN